MKLYLYADKNAIRGPGMVRQNLLKGLEIIGVDITDNLDDADYFGSLVQPSHELPIQTLMGPNLFVIPPESPQICERYQFFLVPCQWVENKYKTFNLLSEKKIFIWPVGIDTDYWNPRNVDKDIDCFIYLKNRSRIECDHISTMCNHFKLKYEIIEYGHYKEESLKDLCNRSRFAILLTNTESQGIAYMNILSMNVPCFVYNMPVWTYQTNRSIKFPATSVPYFNENCGMIVERLIYDQFQVFVNSLNKYDPRGYILEKHNLELGASNYLKLLQQTQ